jgi:hypothetical protein
MCGRLQDYTLAQYKPETFEHLAYSQTVCKLSEKFGYPNDIKHLSFDWQYMMRGLTIDKRRGNVVKVRRGACCYLLCASCVNFLVCTNEQQRRWIGLFGSDGSDAHFLFNMLYGIAQCKVSGARFGMQGSGCKHPHACAAVTRERYCKFD